MLDDTRSLLGRIKELAPHNLRKLHELFIHKRPIELDTDNTIHKGYLDALNKMRAEFWILSAQAMCRARRRKSIRS